jgi:biopolymer transport protein ExbB
VSQLLALAESWNVERVGGARFEGAALDTSGNRHDGRFAVLGPVTYFASSDGAVAGPAVTRIGGTAPSVFEDFDDKTVGTRVASLAAGREADVPLDVTQGDAMRAAATRETLVEHLRKGGFVMFPLLAVGLAALLLMVEKTVALTGIRGGGEAVAQAAEAVVAGRLDEARRAAGRLGRPLGPILRDGIEHAGEPAEHLEELLEERVLAVVPRLERHLQALAVLGAVAPLLGLLGTVTGMIHTFQRVTIFGSGDARMLSGGISEALVTTETGLVIAVPVLLVHAFLSRRVRVIVGELERSVAEFVHELKARAARRGQAGDEEAEPGNA